MKEPISQLLRPHSDPAAIERVASRLRARSSQAPWHKPMVWAAISVSAAATVFLAVELIGRAPKEKRLADGAPLVRLAAISRDTRFALSDGTEIEVSRGAHVERIVNDGGRLVLRQSAGRVRYRVAPQRGGTFVIEAGLASIEVVGTEFDVERRVTDGVEQVEVNVTHGVVVVHSDEIQERVARLEAGDRVLVGSQNVVASSAPSAVSPERRSDEPAAQEPAEVRSSRETLEREASAARPASALQHDDNAPDDNAGGVTRRVRDDELLALADTHRREGRFSEARVILERVAEGPRSPQAALAAYALGVLLEERFREGSRAEEMIERAVAGSLPTALVGSAWARLASLRGTRGDLDGAREAARRAIDAGVSGRELARASAWR